METTTLASTASTVRALCTQRIDCRLCHKRSLVLAFPMEPIPRGDGYTKDKVSEPLLPLDIMFCQRCGHVQISHDVDQSYIYENYLWKTAISPGLVASYEEYVTQFILDYSPRGRGFAVELGSNDGSFSAHLKTRGFKTLGIDPAKEIAAQATKNGLETLPIFFNKLTAQAVLKEYGKASFIFANHMFANINDVQGIVDGVKELLAPDGLFTIQVFYLYDVIKDKLLENFNHEHPSYFYVKTLKAYFDAQGFEMIGAERVNTKGGSIRCVMQRKGGNHPHGVNYAGVEALIEKEEKLGLDQLATYAHMTKHIQTIRAQFKDFFKMARLEGKKVAGYGTSIGATVFTYQYDLGGDLQFLVDDDPIRQGLLNPGYSIPVKHPDAIYAEHIDYVIILAPLYADQIVKRHKKFIDQGGKFLCFRPHDFLEYVPIW